MAETIFVGDEPGTYKAYKTIGGWKLMFLDENGNSRGVDGDKLYPSRQNAYKRSKKLNDSLEETAFVQERIDRIQRTGNYQLSDKEAFLEAYCELLNEQGQAVTAANLADVQYTYSLTACKQFIQENN